MAHYLIQAAYTPQAWAALSTNPQDRAEQVRPAIEAAGGTLRDFYYSFGKFDVVLIVEFPGNTDVAAFAIAAAAGGALKGMQTTPLMTADEGVEMMQKSGATGYVPPAANRP